MNFIDKSVPVIVKIEVHVWSRHVCSVHWHHPPPHPPKKVNSTVTVPMSVRREQESGSKRLNCLCADCAVLKVVQIYHWNNYWITELYATVIFATVDLDTGSVTQVSHSRSRQTEIRLFGLFTTARAKHASHWVEITRNTHTVVKTQMKQSLNSLTYSRYSKTGKTMEKFLLNAISITVLKKIISVWRLKPGRHPPVLSIMRRSSVKKTVQKMRSHLSVT